MSCASISKSATARSAPEQARRCHPIRAHPLFLGDGRIDLDSNVVERSIRPLAPNRKNALFAGSDEGGDNWAVIATLIENRKLSGTNPIEWLTQTLTRLANDHPAKSVGDLMPWSAVA